MEQGTRQTLLGDLAMDPALLQDETERWEAISDLDSFFVRVYSYYRERGLRCILASRIISLLTLAFTIILFVFLVEMLNWHDVVYECTSEATCASVRLVSPDWYRHVSAFRVLYYYLLFTLYWLWTFFQFVQDLRPLIEMRAFYRDKLQLDDADLQARAREERARAYARSAGARARSASARAMGRVSWRAHRAQRARARARAG